MEMLIFANQTAPGYSKYSFTKFKQVRNIDPDSKINVWSEIFNKLYIF